MFSNEHFWWRGGNIEEMFARQTSHGCTGAYCTHLIDYLSHSQNEGKHEEDNLSTFQWNLSLQLKSTRPHVSQG